jgi:hypothetical protein
METPDNFNRERVRRTTEAGNADLPKLFKDAFLGSWPSSPYPQGKWKQGYEYERKKPLGLHKQELMFSKDRETTIAVTVTPKEKPHPR